MDNVILKFKKARKIEKHLQANGVGRGVLKAPSYLDETAPIWVKQHKERQLEEDRQYQLETNTPYYKIHKKPTKELWKQLRAAVLAKQENNVIKPAENTNGIVKGINNYVRELKYDLNNDAVPSGKYTIPATLLAGFGLGSLVQAPLTFATTTLGGMAGDAAVNTGMKLATGKDWALNVHDWTGLDEEAAAVTNPGTIAGGALGSQVPRRIRAVAYNNITPLGYNSDHLAGVTVNKKKEFGLAAKEFFSPKRVNPDTDNPMWMRRVKNNLTYNPNAAMNMSNMDNEGVSNVLRMKDILDFRNQAWAKAMRQKAPNHKLYIDNGDGTVRYNMEYVNSRLYQFNQNTGKYSMITRDNKSVPRLGWNGRVGSQGPMMPHFDSITTNGGGVGLKVTPKGTFMVDKWDLQPFHDFYRSLSPWVTKHLPFMRNFEAVSFVGGDPFVLKTPVPQQSMFDGLNLDALKKVAYGKLTNTKYK